jgi:hypothetical protein
VGRQGGVGWVLELSVLTAVIATKQQRFSDSAAFPGHSSL